MSCKPLWSGLWQKTSILWTFWNTSYPHRKTTKFLRLFLAISNWRRHKNLPGDIRGDSACRKAACSGRTRQAAFRQAVAGIRHICRIPAQVVCLGQVTGSQRSGPAVRHVAEPSSPKKSLLGPSAPPSQAPVVKVPSPLSVQVQV